MNQWRSAYYAGRGSKKNGTQSRVWARQFGAVLAMDEPLSAYAGLAVPVLLIAGTTGPLPARRVTELLGRAFGEEKLRVIPWGGTHGADHPARQGESAHHRAFGGSPDLLILFFGADSCL